MKTQKVKSAPFVKQAIRFLDYEFTEQVTAKQDFETGMAEKVCFTYFKFPSGEPGLYASSHKIRVRRGNQETLIAYYARNIIAAASEVEKSAVAPPCFCRVGA